MSISIRPDQDIMELVEATMEIPLTRFRRELNSILERCSRDKMKVVITRNGEPEFVLIDHRTWENIEALVKKHARIK